MFRGCTCLKKTRPASLARRKLCASISACASCCTADGGVDWQLTNLPADACLAAANAVDDYQCIGWCMHGLDDTALWLLTEVYRPTGFGVHRKTFSQVCKAGRLEFPERQFSVREVRMVHEHALGVVKRGLRLLGLIPIRQPQAVRERRRRV